VPTCRCQHIVGELGEEWAEPDLIRHHVRSVEPEQAEAFVLLTGREPLR
jgi:hypothetical protein